MKKIFQITRNLLKKNYMLVQKFLRFYKANGFTKAIYRVKEYISVRHKMKAIAMSQKNSLKPIFISNRFKVSIVVPLYNTPKGLLIEMIESVIGQTYSNWQLCMTDGSTADFAYVEEVVMGYANKDNRISYKKLEDNYGISANTNYCLKMAEGDYIGLLDHDDLLAPDALAEVMCAAENEGADFIYTDECVFEESPEKPILIYYKPDFGMDTLRSYNYISHFVAFSNNLLKKAGDFRTDFDCSQDYDIYFRLLENAEKVVHIPKILYYWRSHSTSTATDITLKPAILDRAKLALSEHLVRSGLEGVVNDSPARGIYRVSYKIKDNPLVSLIIAGNDNTNGRCIKSIYEKTEYKNYEVHTVPGIACPTTYNKGMELAKGNYIIFLSSDTEVMEKGWIEEMLMFAQREDIGIVGSKLYYPDKTISHAGIVVGLFGSAGCGHRNFPSDHTGYMCRMYASQNISAVSGACMMVKRDVFDKCNGFHEGYKGAYFDVDFCLRASEKDYKIIFTPYAELYHHIEKNRMSVSNNCTINDENNDEKRFTSIWKNEIQKGDKFYNPNLTLDSDNYSFRI